jgi:hypothetical protein
LLYASRRSDRDTFHSLTSAAFGVEVLRGILRNPSETGGWQFDDLDVDEYRRASANYHFFFAVAAFAAASASLILSPMYSWSFAFASSTFTVLGSPIDSTSLATASSIRSY